MATSCEFESRSGHWQDGIVTPPPAGELRSRDAQLYRWCSIPWSTDEIVAMYMEPKGIARMPLSYPSVG